MSKSNEERVCPRCRKELPIRNALTGRLNFSRDGKCKPCSNESGRAYLKTDAGKAARARCEVKRWQKGKLPKWMLD